MRTPSLFPDPDRCRSHGRLYPCMECGRIEGEAKKIKAIEVVQQSPDPDLDAAKKEWLARAAVALHRMALELPDYTGEQLHTAGYIEKPPGDGRLVGAAIRAGGLAGWGFNTHTTRKSTATTYNGTPREVWISLLWGGGGRIVERCLHCDGLGHTVRAAPKAAGTG